MKAAVTGVFSYSGRFIAEALLTRGSEVVALGRSRPSTSESLAERVTFCPLLLDDEEALATALSGCEVLFNTYWVRFEYGGVTFARAIERSGRLFSAARRAGVGRIVHLSVSNASADSPFPYFRGKAAVEDALRCAGCSYAILRPTLIFGGRQEVLVNNIAWLLRRLPLFLLPDGGRCRLQPVSVFDLARIAADLGEDAANVLLDLAGPETFTFADFVAQIRDAVGSHARLLAAPSGFVSAGSTVARFPSARPAPHPRRTWRPNGRPARLQDGNNRESIQRLARSESLLAWRRICKRVAAQLAPEPLPPLSVGHSDGRDVSTQALLTPASAVLQGVHLACGVRPIAAMSPSVGGATDS